MRLESSELALNDDQETEPVEIDNTPPAVTMARPSVSGATATVEFQVPDMTSIIRRGIPTGWR